MTEAAIEWWGKAGQRSFERSALAEAQNSSHGRSNKSRPADNADFASRGDQA